MEIGKPNEFTSTIYNLDKNGTLHNHENVAQENDIGVIMDIQI